MTAVLPALVDAFAGLRVVVVGDAALDRWLVGRADRLSREGPVPVVRTVERVERPGGAANTAANLAALGASVELLAAVGADDDGDRLLALLRDAGVGTDGLVRSPGRRTTTLTRVVAGGHLVVRYDEGDSSPLPEPLEQVLVTRLAERLATADAVVVADYGHGALTPWVVSSLAPAARRAVPLVVDSKHPARFRSLAPTAVKPNWGEAVALLGRGELDGVSERADGLADEGDRILELTGARIAAVTLDADGALVFERGHPPHRTHAHVEGPVDPCGAGDTFVATLALALAAGAGAPVAAELASAAASVVVAKPWTACCSADELRARVDVERLLKGVDALDVIVQRVAEHRRRGRRIVFTNGCFDLLHRGHITYLNRAKNLGDVLVVGLNTDASVRRLKGSARPINALEDRAGVLGALSCVDHLVAFDGDTPADLIRAIRPDVYAKGGDYTLDRLPEAPVVAEVGAEVRLLPFMEDRSTSGMIERILDLRAQQRA